MTIHTGRCQMPGCGKKLIATRDTYEWDYQGKRVNTCKACWIRREPPKNERTGSV